MATRMGRMNRAAATSKGNVYELDRQAGTIEVIEVAAHRNGIGGAPFHVVSFNHDTGEGPGVERFVATVFEGAGLVSVLSVDRLAGGTIEFGAGGNSWRGDVFEPALRVAIRRYES